MIDIPDIFLPKDKDGQPLCPKCQKSFKDCDCPAAQSPKPGPLPAQARPVIRTEKKGRNGKVVTVIEKLSSDESWLRDLADQLKKKLGSGGTSYVEAGQGVIEIQGDKRTAVQKIWEQGLFRADPDSY